jgi:hypothetical protein
MTVLNAPKRCHRFLSWRNCVNRATWKERSKNAAPAYENGYPAYAACGFPPTPAAPGIFIAISENPAQTARKLP